MPDFRCLKCHKRQNEWELDFHQRTATCKTCAPNYPEERANQGPWLMQNGQPLGASTRKP